MADPIRLQILNNEELEGAVRLALVSSLIGGQQSGLRLRSVGARRTTTAVVPGVVAVVDGGRVRRKYDFTAPTEILDFATVARGDSDVVTLDVSGDTIGTRTVSISGIGGSMAGLELLVDVTELLPVTARARTCVCACELLELWTFIRKAFTRLEPSASRTCTIAARPGGLEAVLVEHEQVVRTADLVVPSTKDSSRRAWTINPRRLEQALQFLDPQHDLVIDLFDSGVVRVTEGLTMAAVFSDDETSIPGPARRSA